MINYYFIYKCPTIDIERVLLYTMNSRFVVASNSVTPSVEENYWYIVVDSNVFSIVPEDDIQKYKDAGFVEVFSEDDYTRSIDALCEFNNKFDTISNKLYEIMKSGLRIGQVISNAIHLHTENDKLVVDRDIFYTADTAFMDMLIAESDATPKQDEAPKKRMRKSKTK